MKNRNTKIDIIKGLGIILIVLGHTQMVLCRFVNLFHVGLFFIASGYCYKEKYSEKASDLKIFLIKRIKGLYVPFVLWNLGYLCFRNLFSIIGIYNASAVGIEAFVKQAIDITLLKAGEELAGPCWFVRALFILEVLFVITDGIIKWMCKGIYRRIMRWLAAIIMLLVGAWFSRRGIVLPYNIATICSAWILYVFGLELKNIIDKKGLEWETNLKRTFIFGICGLVLFVLNRFGSISYDANNYPNILFFLLAAVAGWGMVWEIAGMIEQSLPRLERAFVYIGRRTMNILFLHLLCFKPVSALYAFVYGLERTTISAFPVITNQWWILYWIAGVGGALILCFIEEQCKKKIVDTGTVGRWREAACLAGLLVILVPNAFIYTFDDTGKEDLSTIVDYEELDYSLIYEKDCYLDYNQDIEEVIGDNSEELLKHFITYGMDEGRIASEKFDVYYYRENNSDLKAAYGDDLRQYYLHYMLYGYTEGRSGSKIIIYESSLRSEIVDEHTLEFYIGATSQELAGESYFVFALPAYQYEIAKEDYLSTGIFTKEDISIRVNYDVKAHLNEKYVLAQKMESGYVIISNDAYISNAEILCRTNVERPFTDSKKGLQMANAIAENGKEVMEDLEMLNPSYPFMNLIIENIMYPHNMEMDVITYTYKEKDYYFQESVILKYDEVISTLTKRGASITASVLSIKRDGFEELYYPDISMDTNATYYAINTTNQTGTEYLEAFVSFMSERYNGTMDERGLIANWIVGNEVNESATYNYMGEKDITDYLKEYTRTFRVIYNIVRSNISSANVYVPMEPWWGIGSNNLTYGGREFLSRFNQMMHEEGDIDWGLAYHAYSYPLSDPKVLNDTERTIDENGELTLEGYVTTDSERSITITMENIEVLVEFMKQKEFLDKRGEVRSIILSEQGYTSNSYLYGKCEAQQAASMVYAYYKAEMNKDIDAFIYFLQRDTKSASLGNDYYLFGLEGENEDGTLEKKLSYEVYQVMDTKESLQELWYIKNILDIDSWDEVIPGFDEGIFDQRKDWNVTKSKTKDISLATVDEIAAQKYTGQECLPALSISFEGVLLTNDVDYDIVYINNIEKGTAKAVIVGLNDFYGVKEVLFEIEE